MANSSSALTLISRAFSSASCLMNAVCKKPCVTVMNKASVLDPLFPQRPNERWTDHLAHFGHDFIVCETWHDVCRGQQTSVS